MENEVQIKAIGGSAVEASDELRSRALKDCRRWAECFNGGMTTPHSSSKDPLHGVTLEALLTELVAHYGWEELGQRFEIRCFNFDPSIKSSLQFLRKTPWARKKVEDFYIYYKRQCG